MVRVVVAIVLVAMHAGCASHVTLPAAPGKDASFSERRAFYDKAKPVNVKQAVPERAFGTLETIFDPPRLPLMLADGTQVSYPEDLLPVLEASSPGALAASASASKRSTGETLSWGGGALGVAGMATTAGIVLYSFNNDVPVEVAFVVGAVGFGVGLVGGVTNVIGSFFSRAAKAQRDTAFTNYDESLLSRLAISRHQGLVDTGPPATPPTLTHPSTSTPPSTPVDPVE